MKQPIEKANAEVWKNKAGYFCGKIYLLQREGKDYPVHYSIEIYPQKSMRSVILLGNSLAKDLSLPKFVWKKD